MQLDDDPPGKDEAPAKPPHQRPRSALEVELDKALDRLDHQVEDTKNYLATLDRQIAPALRRRRKGDIKPTGGRERGK